MIPTPKARVWYGGCVYKPRSRRLRGAKKGRKDMLLNVTRVFRSFRRNEDGQDLLEYALLVALIAIVAVTAVTAAGVEVDAIFQDIVAKLPG